MNEEQEYYKRCASKECNAVMLGVFKGTLPERIYCDACGGNGTKFNSEKPKPKLGQKEKE